ncbi:hypothetical protein B0H10DRAFT_1942752 [Mycena sp. CBHHK59/15]|nr:hypothetical protein B0H10DRAFT_1942752 [Mycena sp. CBHHK59/15]
MSMSHSRADIELIDGLSHSDVKLFREHMYGVAYIRENSHLFLDNAWIDVAVLPRDTGSWGSRTRHNQNDRKLIELLSDSDSEPGRPMAFVPEDTGGSSNIPSSPTAYSPQPDDYDLAAVQESDTCWMDPDISSTFRIIHHELTSDLCSHVEQLEYLTEIPTFWPVLRVPTAFIVDLSHPKFDEYLDEKYTVDAMLKDKDNNSWTGNTGMGDMKVEVTFSPLLGSDVLSLVIYWVFLRFSHPRCEPRWLISGPETPRGLHRGCHARAEVDPTLLNVVWWELDTSSRDTLHARSHSALQCGRCARSSVQGEANP